MSTASSKELCTCGHEHGRNETCGAIISGTPMLNYCPCPGLMKPGEHLRPLVGNPQ